MEDRKINCQREIFLLLGQGRTIFHVDVYDTLHSFYFDSEGEILYDGHSIIYTLPTIYPEHLTDGRWYTIKE